MHQIKAFYYTNLKAEVDYLTKYTNVNENKLNEVTSTTVQEVTNLSQVSSGWQCFNKVLTSYFKFCGLFYFLRLNFNLVLFTRHVTTLGRHLILFFKYLPILSLLTENGCIKTSIPTQKGCVFVTAMQIFYRHIQVIFPIMFVIKVDVIQNCSYRGSLHSFFCIIGLFTKISTLALYKGR